MKTSGETEEVSDERMAEAEEKEVDEMILDSLKRTLRDSKEKRAQNQDRKEGQPEPDAFELPPIEAVDSVILPLSDSWYHSHGHGGGRGGVGWTPGTRDKEKDEKVGRRGEEIVYRNERERVIKLGFPESRVIWSSQKNQGSDHDILSVDDDARTLWIEVKSTTGRDGRFQWSTDEFSKALLERNQYILVRVYEAHTARPKIRTFRDPISIFLKKGMYLDIATFRAEVEPFRDQQSPR